MMELRKTIFMADLHLDNRYPSALTAFRQYFAELEHQPVDAVYILGDLFEYWLGDDCSDKTGDAVASVLSEYVHRTHVPVYYTHGNRDFLLGEEYAKRCCMKILPETAVINLYGVKTLVLHGDTLCIDDVDYMRFREKVRDSAWKNKILSLPRWARRLKAWQMRRQSKKANARKNNAIMDVSQSAVADIMQANRAVQMIHGHTHRPAIHEFDVNGQLMRRCVVDDWYTQGSVLEVTADGQELLSWSL